MDEQKVNALVADIRERLARIETILQSWNFKEIEEVANEAKLQAEKNAKDIAEIQAGIKWVVMAIIGAFIAAVCALVFK